jgi:transcriptional regulator with XRE-family HTH domain
MVERIKQLLEKKKLTATQFSDEIGVQRSSLSHVLSGRNKPSLDFMLKVKERYPEINLNWLLLGEGDMTENSIVKEELPEKGVMDKRQEMDVEKNELDEISKTMIVEEPIQKSGKLPNYSKIIAKQSDEVDMVITFFGDGSFKVYNQKK